MFARVKVKLLGLTDYPCESWLAGLRSVVAIVFWQDVHWNFTWTLLNYFLCVYLIFLSICRYVPFIRSISVILLWDTVINDHQSRRFFAYRRTIKNKMAVGNSSLAATRVDICFTRTIASGVCNIARGIWASGYMASVPSCNRARCWSQHG